MNYDDEALWEQEKLWLTAFNSKVLGEAKEW